MSGSREEVGDEMEDVYIDERLIHLIQNSKWSFCGLSADALTRKTISIHDQGPWCGFCFDERLSAFLENER